MAGQALKPCPLCAGAFGMSQEPRDVHPVNGMWYIYHLRETPKARACRLHVSGHFDSEEDALTFWNTDSVGRRAEPDLLGRLKAVERWLTAALECAAWQWDRDQRDAATRDRDAARAAIALARAGAK
jgi:hypothetical protein